MWNGPTIPRFKMLQKPAMALVWVALREPVTSQWTGPEPHAILAPFKG